MALKTQVMSPWRWGLSGALVGALVGLLWFAPAHWLAAAVHQASHGQISLQDARGTVWDGSAQLTLTGGAGSPAAATLPSRLHWTLQPSGLGLALQLHTPCCLPQPWQVLVQPRWGGLQVAFSDTASTWPASLLAGLGTPFNTLALQGQLMFSPQGLSASWVAGRGQLVGTAQLQLQEVSSRLSTLSPMGSYRLTLAGGSAPELQLATLQGPLQLSGRGQWVGGKLRFVGEASSAPEHLGALSNLLNIIGRRSGARSVITLG